MNRIRWLLLVSLFGLILSTLVVSGEHTIAAAAPAIKLSAGEGVVGSALKVTVSGFPASVGVRIRFDGQTITSGTTNGRGRFTYSFAVPDSTAGEHSVRADSGRVVVSGLFVTDPAMTVSPGTIRLGESVEVRLSGFGARERVVLWLSAKGELSRLTTVRSNGTGSTTKIITIPGSAPTSTGTILAEGEQGNNSSGKVKIKAGSVTQSPTAFPSPTSATQPLTSIPAPTRTLTQRPTPIPTPTPRATLTTTVTATATATRTPTGATISIWVNPNSGSDSNTGASRSNAVRTIEEAWSRIPAGTALQNGYRIRLVTGNYPANGLPNYMEQRYGTSDNMITIEAADEPGSVVITGNWNIFDVRYLTMSGLTMVNSGDVVHCEQCQHFSIVNSTLDGQGSAHETLKINQSQYITISGSDLSGSYENAIDFVAVQHGEILNNLIHDAEDWCMYLKGGSADFWIEGNEIYNCGTGGFTAGQGTGFQFMTPPYLTFEAIDITFIRNEIHDTDGAGMGVNGGNDILLAENHLVRTGARSHLLEIGFGGRSCDGQPGDEGRERCALYLADGGWGTTAVDDGDNFVRIPNKNVIVRDNTFENPNGYQSQWQHFFIAGPYSGGGQTGSNAPNPASADDGLVITGNVITNGAQSMSLGLGDDSGCQPTNPSCNETQLYRDNDINGQ